MSRHFARAFVWACVLLAGCKHFGNLPWAPLLTRAEPGNTSASISFAAPVYTGRSAISTYVVNCTAAGESWSARGSASPLTVWGLSNGVEYTCDVRASNAGGTSPTSSAVRVTPQPDPANSLASGYRLVFFSDTSSIHMLEVCRKLSFANLVTGGVFSFKVKARKPGAAMYEAFETRYGKPCFYVDDRPDNIQAGISRGWNSHQFVSAAAMRHALTG